LPPSLIDAYTATAAAAPAAISIAAASVTDPPLAAAADALPADASNALAPPAVTTAAAVAAAVAIAAADRPAAFAIAVAITPITALLSMWPTAGAPPLALLEAAGFDSPVGWAWRGTASKRFTGWLPPQGSHASPEAASAIVLRRVAK
jgi:hypothetical protein